MSYVYVTTIASHIWNVRINSVWLSQCMFHNCCDTLCLQVSSYKHPFMTQWLWNTLRLGVTWRCTPRVILLMCRWCAGSICMDRCPDAHHNVNVYYYLILLMCRWCTGSICMDRHPVAHHNINVNYCLNQVFIMMYAAPALCYGAYCRVTSRCNGSSKWLFWNNNHYETEALQKASIHLQKVLNPKYAPADLNAVIQAFRYLTEEALKHCRDSKEWE